MENKMNGRGFIALLLVALLGGGMLFGLNNAMAPIAEKNNNAAQLAPLYEIMPEAKGFECLFDATEPDAATIAVEGVTVQAMYRETDGLGYIAKLSTTEGYTKEPMNLTVCFTNDGKVADVIINTYPDTKDVGEAFPQSFIGQDSAMPDVELVAGVTFSSKAIKNAIAEAFDALIANELVAAGLKDDSQLLLEQLPVLVPGIANPDGIGQYEAAEVSGTYIYSKMAALNGSCCAFLANYEQGGCLVAVNTAGTARAYAADGSDITGEVPAALLEEAIGAAETTAATDKEVKKLVKLLGDEAVAEAVPVADCFNSVVGAYVISLGEESYYGVIAKPYGYSNIPMTYYFVFDANGAIAGMKADELILHKDYFSAYELDENAYREGFTGMTADSYTEDAAFISGATFSAHATSTATQDAFEALADILANGGVNNG